jgi:hypothetical protein
MKINFTKKQFKDLIKMVYIGNWVINAVRGGEGDKKRIEKYEILENYVFSFAKDFGLENLVEYDEKYKKFFPTDELWEGEARELIDYYDEDIFWEELIHRMAERDFFREYGWDKISKMKLEERIRKDHPFLEKYYDEIGNNGIENLDIVCGVN